MIVGNARKHKFHTWWLNLFNRVNKGPNTPHAQLPENVKIFDPTHMHAKFQPKEKTPAYIKSFDASMEIYAKYLAKEHDMSFHSGCKTRSAASSFTRQSDGVIVTKPWSKYKEPPDIYIQKAVPKMTDSSTEADHELIKRAIRDLRKMLELPKDKWVDEIDTRNTAFRDMVYELERKYVHEERFRRDESSKVFDSEMKRMEIRNVRKYHQPSKKHFENCLVVRYYNPKGPANGGLKKKMTTNDKGEPVPEKTADGKFIYEPPPEKDFEEKTYYATRSGKAGNAVCSEAEPTMWCGDALGNQ